MAGPMRTVKPKRPPNSWILFRADVSKRLPSPGPGQPRRSQADVSALISNMWKDAPDDVKQRYERLAEEAKVEHRKKYPNYKFQPTKKEDKERQKEIQKEQREQTRKNRSVRGVNRSSPPPVATRLAASAPYQIPHLLFGPSGPTPPVSAASSPRDDLLSSPIPSSSTSIQPSLTPGLSPLLSLPPTLPTIHTATTSLHLPLPSLPFPISQTQAHVLFSQVGSPATTQAHAKEPDVLPETSGDLSTYGTSILERWAPGAEASGASSTIFFNVGENTLNDLQTWTEDPSFFMDPFQSANPAAGMFEIRGFNDLLAMEPVGDLEVSLGDLDENPISSSYFDAYGEPQLDASNAYMASYPPQLDFTQLMSDLMTVFPDIPTHPEVPTTLSATNLADDVTDANPAPTQSTSYLPPAGAANSSMRRVGAKWTPEVMNIVSPPQQVPA